jgi:DNA polymerase-3 subunit epsilon
MDTELKNLEVLVLDFQATGANPKHGHLLEAAWCRVRSGKGSKIHSRLVKLPRGHKIPRRVSKITGIYKEDLKSAALPRQVWDSLIHRPPPATVIHFARYELPFLKDLHYRFKRPKKFPFEIVCTHEISRRLFPDLPRRTLRALAGYFGHHTHEYRRAAEHVSATVFIWQKMIEVLDTECAVRTLSDLRSWLDEPPPKKSSKKAYPIDRTARLNLPDRPGVYRLIDPSRRVLYVGKATSIKSRVNSYFQKQKGYSERTLELLTRVREVDVTETGSALEAALLEADEIKKRNPPYNQALKVDDHRVWFFSPDLKTARSHPDRNHKLGPVPSRDDLAAIRRLIDGRQPPRVLRIPPGCYQAGLKLFKQRHRVPFQPKDLLRLGGFFWIVEEVEDDDEEERSHTWDPEMVASYLEGVIRHAAHMLRRSRWLKNLADSTLTWQTRNASKRTIAHNSRIQDFNASVYDRLRVFTTELKRLVSENRPLELHLSNKTLDTPHLARLLRWL